ncbi:MAG: hypothetical protein GYA15_12260 [Leptolinea sp.]|jgi:hypothetical protein|nr:hypothetical protein [Leptolinea sp.]
MICANILIISGLILGFLGSLIIAKELILTKREAANLGVPHLAANTEEENENLPLAQFFIKQSNSAIIGIILICSGFFFQLIGALIIYI